ncbi:MAG: hypothetical protein GY780_01055 [bacterium]|nr:hypothetical protein [bacterium]
MKRIQKSLMVVIGGILVLALSGGSALAQTEVTVNYSWSAPTTGSPVGHYVVQHSVNGGAWNQIATAASNSYTLTATIGDSHRIRVAGVDDQDRQGSYSEPSDTYTPELGPPGQPGKPILF